MTCVRLVVDSAYCCCKLRVCLMYEIRVLSPIQYMAKMAHISSASCMSFCVLLLLLLLSTLFVTYCSLLLASGSL